MNCLLSWRGMVVAVVLGAASSSAAAQEPDTTTSTYEVRGVRVIHRRAANDIVAANLYLLGGTREITFANAGIEPMLLRVSERGTMRFTREALRRTFARTGGTVIVEGDADWSVIGLRTTVSGFRETWPAFADRVVAPRLDPADVATERSLTVSALAQRRDSPDALVEYLADSVAFSNHPYGIDPQGTERSIGSLAPEALRAFHRAKFVTSRMLLVVVGNVERAVLDSLVASTLGTMPAGAYRWTLPDTIARRDARAFREARALPTNYLLGYAPGPRADHADYDALRVACTILSGQLFSEIRSRQSLTYAVNAPFEERALSAVGLYVSTNDPVAALAAMREQIRSLQDMSLDQRSLAPIVQLFITEYFLDNETNAAQADFLARGYLYLGDWKRASEFTNRIRAVTPDDVQRVMRRYFRDITFAYVGDPARLPESALRAFSSTQR